MSQKWGGVFLFGFIPVFCDCSDKLIFFALQIMKSLLEKYKPLFLPIFSIVMGLVILLTQKNNPDFIISKDEYLFAGFSLIIIGLGLLFVRFKSHFF